MRQIISPEDAPEFGYILDISTSHNVLRTMLIFHIGNGNVHAIWEHFTHYNADLVIESVHKNVTPATYAKYSVSEYFKLPYNDADHAIFELTDDEVLNHIVMEQI